MQEMMISGRYKNNIMKITIDLSKKDIKPIVRLVREMKLSEGDKSKVTSKEIRKAAQEIALNHIRFDQDAWGNF